MGYIQGDGRNQATLINERATPAAMRLRGLAGAQTEISIAIMAYNFKRIVKILGATPFTQALSPA